MSWGKVSLGEVADVNWGDTSVTKASYVVQGEIAFSATGGDGFLPYADYDRDGIVLSAIGAQCGKTWYVSGKWSCIKNTIRFWSTTNFLDNRYLYWATAEQSFWPKRGAAQPFITIGDARATKIPLPPIDEQRWIAAILDQADALRCARRRTLDCLNDLGPAIFHEMFGPARISANRVTEIGDRLDFLTSGSRGWAKHYAESGSLFLRIQNVGYDELRLDDIAYVTPPETAEAKRTKVEAGDVLLSITADLGRTAVIPGELAEAYINQHLAILRSKHFNPRFLSAALASPIARQSIERRNKGGVKAGLNFEDVRSLVVPDVKREAQDEFDRRVQAVDRLKLAARLSAGASERLFISLQHLAFSGELTKEAAAIEMRKLARRA
ncbi:MAG TPA: restriction endonuclease subunit S [Dongiaceae bacterium]|nr:restriction endonuclease subunit S [Dongiaceae bacterium]